jgi:hypothetical protein
VVLGQEDVLRENDGVFGYNSSRYNVTLAEGRVEFGLPAQVGPLGMPLLSYSLGEVRVNDRLWASGGKVPGQAQPSDRSVSFDRGAVEERYVLGRESLEQVFVIRDLPPDRGAIRVVGAVDTNLTPPAEGTLGSSLLFSSGGEGLVSVSQAMAVDAAGRSITLDLAWKQGQLELTVPEAWVAQATLPIQIDPAIAGIVRLGQVPNQQGFPSNVDVAYNSALNEWLVIYANTVGTTGIEIDGMRMNPAGAPVVGAGGLTIATTSPAPCNNPVVSYASGVNRYLVVWVRTFSSTSASIVGRILNSDGTPFAAEFTISTVAGVNEFPSVASDGTNWFVVYDTFSTGFIRGTFVSSAGVVGPEADPEPVNSLVEVPVVRFGNGVYVILWTNRQQQPWTVMGRTLNPSTHAFLMAATVIGSPAQFQYDICAGGGNFLAAWSGGGVLSAAILSPALALQTGPLQLYPREDSPGLTSSETYPKIVFSSVNQDWYVLDSESYFFSTGPSTFGTWGDILGGRHVSLSGVISPRETLSDGSSPIIGTSLAYNPVTNQALYFVQEGQGDAGRIDLGLPQTPSGFVATPGNQQVLLTWTPLAGATSYAVAQATAPGGPFHYVGTFLTSPSFTDTGLTNGTTYYYFLTAHVLSTDTPAARASATPQKFALMVVGNTTLGAGDAAIQTRLQNLGYTVTAKSGPASAAADATGKALVVISSTVTSSDVNTKFRTATVPVLLWESALYQQNYMGLAGPTSGTDYGTIAGQTQVTITNPTHPMAAGLSGNVAVTTSAQTLSWGRPNANAVSVAKVLGDTTNPRQVIFGYDKGAVMPGLTAPARRVGFLLEDATAGALAANGGALFDAAVQWVVAPSGAAPMAGQAALAGPASGGTPAISVNGQGSYSTVQEAIDAAASGDTVFLAPMTFQVSGGLTLKEGVSLRGAAPHQTVLDAGGAPTVIVASGSGLGAPSIVEHLTITGGSVGISVPSSSIFLRNVQIVRLSGDGIVTGSQGAVEGVSLTIADNGGSGLVLGSPQAILRGLIVARNQRQGVTGPPLAQVSYSSFFDNGSGAASGGIDLTGNGNLFTRFGFQNPAGLDYRELPGSPSINAGNPADAFRLEPQPNGGRVNQGAFGNTPFATP